MDGSLTVSAWKGIYRTHCSWLTDKTEKFSAYVRTYFLAEESLFLSKINVSFLQFFAAVFILEWPGHFWLALLWNLATDVGFLLNPDSNSDLEWTKMWKINIQKKKSNFMG